MYAFDANLVPRCIFLTGAKGAGKSALARSLAEELTRCKIINYTHRLYAAVSALTNMSIATLHERKHNDPHIRKLLQNVGDAAVLHDPSIFINNVNHAAWSFLHSVNKQGTIIVDSPRRYRELPAPRTNPLIFHIVDPAAHRSNDITTTHATEQEITAHNMNTYGYSPIVFSYDKTTHTPSRFVIEHLIPRVARYNPLMIPANQRT